MRNRMQNGTLIVGLLCIFAAPAFAQQADVPPVRPLVDQNGVSLMGRSLVGSDPGPSVGDPKMGGLARSNLWYKPWFGVYYDDFQSNLSPTNAGWQVILGRRTETFTLCSSSCSGYFSDQGNGSTFTQSGTNYYYTDRDGMVATFQTIGSSYRLVTMAWPDGNIWTFNYNGSGRVASVTTSLGYQLHFEYGSGVSAPNKVVAINNAVDYCGPTDLTCTALTRTWPSMTATGQVQLQSVTTGTYTDSLGRVTTYDASASACSFPYADPWSPGATASTLRITRSSGPQATITRWRVPLAGPYPQPNPVICVTTPTGTWMYQQTDYTAGTGPVSSSLPYSTTTVHDPQGNTRVVAYVSLASYSTLIADTDELGRKILYDGDGYGRIAKITLPEGNYQQYTYDDRGNITQRRDVAKTGSGLADIVTQFGYDATCSVAAKCNKPNTATDPKGQVTNFTYSTVHGALLSELKPADPNGVRPAVAYSYAQIATFAKNSSGTLVQAGSIWRRTGEMTCRTTAATITATSTSATLSCAGGVADQVSKTISYSGSNNAQPMSVTVTPGDGSAPQTTTTSYDYMGNALTVTSPRGN